MWPYTERVRAVSRGQFYPKFTLMYANTKQNLCSEVEMLQRFWENQMIWEKFLFSPFSVPIRKCSGVVRVGRGFDSPPLGPVSLGKSFSYFGTLTPSPIFPKIIAASSNFQKYATILGFLANTTLRTFHLRLFTTCNCFCLGSLWGEQIC